MIHELFTGQEKGNWLRNKGHEELALLFIAMKVLTMQPAIGNLFGSMLLAVDNERNAVALELRFPFVSGILKPMLKLIVREVLHAEIVDVE